MASSVPSDWVLCGACEMAHGRSEDLGSDLSMHVRWLISTYKYSCREANAMFWLPQALKQTHGTHTQDSQHYMKAKRQATVSLQKNFLVCLVWQVLTNHLLNSLPSNSHPASPSSVLCRLLLNLSYSWTCTKLQLRMEND